MNRDRRKRIADLVSRIEQMHVDLGALMGESEDIGSEEEDYYDSMPESIQSGSRGELAGESITALETATEALDTAVDALSEAVDSLNEATQ